MTLSDEFPWYRAVPSTERLTQGDILFDCPVLEWGEVSPDVKEHDLQGIVEVQKQDLIVMTQACDLEHGKIANVILCAHRGLQEFKIEWEDQRKARGLSVSAKEWSKEIKTINAGYRWSMASIAASESPKFDVRIVNFHYIYSLPLDFIDVFLSKSSVQRPRLLPPYREYLSQSFARYFMRVGLPIDLKLP